MRKNINIGGPAIGLIFYWHRHFFQAVLGEKLPLPAYLEGENPTCAWSFLCYSIKSLHGKNVHLGGACVTLQVGLPGWLTNTSLGYTAHSLEGTVEGSSHTWEWSWVAHRGAEKSQILMLEGHFGPILALYNIFKSLLAHLPVFFALVKLILGTF